MKNDSKLIVTEYRDYFSTFLFEEGDIAELFLSAKRKFNLNDIFVGRISNVKNDIKACFVDFNDSVTGFLPFSEINTDFLLNRSFDGRLKQGDLVLVQVVKEPVKSKEAALSMNITLPGIYSIVTTDDSGIHVSSKLCDSVKKELKAVISEQNFQFGCILRTNSSKIPADELVKELKVNNEKLHEIKEIMKFRPMYTCLYKAMPSYIEQIKSIDKNRYSEIITDKEDIYEILNGFDNVKLYKDEKLPLKALFSFDKAFDLATKKEVLLKDGGSIVIEATEALTVVDVNSNKFDKKVSKDEAVLHINKIAAKETARQLRLRNISGIIIVDFINFVRKEDEAELLEYFKSELKKDYVKCKLIDITPLGLVEITREKRYSSIYDQLKKVDKNI